MTAVDAAVDIAVVGAGPVGVYAALRAAQAGYSVLLLDSASAPPESPPSGDYDLRVVALAPRCQRGFAACGAWPQELNARVQPYRQMQVWDGAGRGKIAFSAAELAVEDLGCIVEVPALQWALDQAASGRLTRWQSASYRSHVLGPDGLQLQCADGRRASAQLLIGADGRDSRVRKRAGIGVAARAYAEQGLVAVVRPELAHEGVARQAFTALGALGLLPLASGELSIVWSVAADDAERLSALPAAEFCRELSAAAGQPIAALCSSRLGFPLHLQHATAYAADGVALVGDAAHVVHPLAGLGMNLGFLDAECLVDHLGPRPARGRAWATWPVLQRYSRQRRRAVLPALNLIDAMQQAFAPAPPGLRPLAAVGLGVTDRLRPIKHALARYALGEDRG